MKETRYNKYLNNDNNFITVDVGGRASNSGTAIALFQPDLNHPIKTKLFYANLRTVNYEERSHIICINMKIHLVSYKNCIAFIEQPEYFNSERGEIAAKTGNLRKLIFLYGRIYQLLYDMGFSPVPLRIVDWKGQMNKKQVESKLTRIGAKVYKNDKDDAQAMGYYLKGMF